MQNKSLYMLLRILMYVSIFSLVPATFRFLHFPGATFLVLGCMLLIISLTFIIANLSISSRNRTTRTTWFLGWLFISLFSTGVLFLTLHWPGGAVIYTITIVPAILGMIAITYGLKMWTRPLRIALAAWGCIPSLSFCIVRTISLYHINQLAAKFQPAIEWSFYSPNGQMRHLWTVWAFNSYAIALAICSVVMLIALKKENNHKLISPNN